MLTLWSMPSSGNSYKVRLLLALLERPFEHIGAENGDALLASEKFRALNPDGKLPVIVLDDSRVLRESNAILLYLANGTSFLPADTYAQALCHQWMFFEQYNHEPTIAVRAGILAYENREHLRTPEILDPLLEKGHAALATMERQLQTTDYLTGDKITVADICLYAYTHTAGTKGGFEMDRFPAINSWLARVAAQENYVPLEWLPDAK